jgi:tRNA-splicing ligase RtcB
MGAFHGPIEADGCCRWRIPKHYRHDMRVDGVIYANDALMKVLMDDQAPEQVANVATLPGIQVASIAMPDIHWGYGFPIGGVAATDPKEGGVISPGGVGYDINCGVRLVRTSLKIGEIQNHLHRLVDKLFEVIPGGVGKSGKYRFNAKEMNGLLGEGVSWLADRGLVTRMDVEHTEAGGYLAGADPKALSEMALKRGMGQCGTLGSGNHFLEIQVVDRIENESVAKAFGLEKDQVVIMIHSGSRGLGYQVCDDALDQFRNAPRKYGITLPDRQLACAPAESPEGRGYIAAMRSAAHFAWCNRQILMQLTREAFAEVLGETWQSLKMSLLYDVCHNIAKLEEHTVGGKKKKLWVHRKGATRAFPADHPEVPDAYRSVGQPVLIPGDMGRASWVLVGLPGSMEHTFGTTCHGAGRLMSRTEAINRSKGRRIDQELLARGVIARSQTRRGLEEEQPDAYKDVDEVVATVDQAGLSGRVARLRPVGVVKG